MRTSAVTSIYRMDVIQRRVDLGSKAGKIDIGSGLNFDSWEDTFS